MTFLLPYSMLRKKWKAEHRQLAVFDLSIGLIIPFVLATGSSWGTLSILEPLVIPICHNLSLAEGLAVGDDNYMVYMAGSIASAMT